MNLLPFALALQGLLAYDSITTEEGLPSNTITEIVSDSRGYLWIGTADGLSRYDGERVVNYGAADGLPHTFISTIVEDHNGAMWVATGRGVARLDPSSRRGKLFTSISNRGANDLAEDAQHRMWAGCGDDLCFAEGDALKIDPAFRAAGGLEPRILEASPDGTVWAGSSRGLLRRAGGHWKRYVVKPHRGNDFVEGLMIDRDGTAWLSTGWGVFIIGRGVWDLPADKAISERVARTVLPGETLRMPDANEIVFLGPTPDYALMLAHTAFRARDGSVWIPCGLGVIRVAGGNVTLLDHRAALPETQINAAGEDSAGNLWLGSATAGVLRISALGITRFTRDSGLAQNSVASIFELADGRLCATTNNEFLSCIENGAFHSARIVPEEIRFKGWAWHQVFADNQWAASGEGLVRWPVTRSVDELARAKPLSIDRRFGEEVFRVFTDSRGVLWVGAFGKHQLARRDGDTFTDFPAPRVATAFAEDAHGTIWAGFFGGGVGRIVNGRLELFDARNGIPPRLVNDLFFDSRGRLWIGTTEAVLRIDDPAAAAIAAKRVEGLTSTRIACLAEARDGRIAIGTTRGLDLLDTDTGEITHLGTHDGLSRNGVGVAYRDRTGTLWLGSADGLWRMDRLPARAALVPRTPRFDRIDVAGAALPTPELGLQSLAGIRLKYPDRRLTLSFSAPHFDSGGPLRFEYRLDGDAKWIDAADRRSVTYESLSFGGHRFEVRARNASGRASPPATASFDVIPPLWRRPWMQLLGAALGAALALLLHRLRVRHILALQEVRDRVATDLHDDLGSSLSRISLLTELAKTEKQDEPLLAEIGDTARGLVDTLGDSIWAIDPKRDDVRSLISRVRHFAAGLFEAKSIAMDFRVDDAAAQQPLGPEHRRDVYLVLKEALHNAARHSGAKRVAVTAGVEGHRLRIAIADDGRGFDERTLVPREDGGRGLASMRERMARAGGALVVDSAPGRGTRIDITVPL